MHLTEAILALQLTLGSDQITVYSLLQHASPFSGHVPLKLMSSLWQHSWRRWKSPLGQHQKKSWIVIQPCLVQNSSGWFPGPAFAHGQWLLCPSCTHQPLLWSHRATAQPMEGTWEDHQVHGVGSLDEMPSTAIHLHLKSPKDGDSTMALWLLVKRQTPSSFKSWNAVIKSPLQNLLRAEKPSLFQSSSIGQVLRSFGRGHSPPWDPNHISTAPHGLTHSRGAGAGAEVFLSVCLSVWGAGLGSAGLFSVSPDSSCLLHAPGHSWQHHQQSSPSRLRGKSQPH